MANLSSPLTSKLSLRRIKSGSSGVPLSPGALTIDTALTSCRPLPPSALFVGMADDGLSVLINLAAPISTPVLIAADAGAGKTRLLQTVARSIELTHPAEHVSYAVITEHPAEWVAFEGSAHCDGILPFHHGLTTGYLNSALPDSPAPATSSLILLVDGLEGLASDADLRRLCVRLLQRTPAAVWPLITVNTSGSSVPTSWLDAFRVRLFGYIMDGPMPAQLGGPSPTVLRSLQPPSQFAVREGDTWLKFWLPDLD